MEEKRVTAKKWDQQKDIPVAQDVVNDIILVSVQPQFFSNIEKWSNSARFHAVGCTARLVAEGAIYLQI